MPVRRPRLGIDMDGVVVDTRTVWKEHFDAHAEEHGHVSAYESAPYWGYSADLCARCLEDCIASPEILSKTPLMEGAKEALAELSGLADLYLVSHRDPALRLAASMLLGEHGVLQHFRECHWISERASKRALCERLALDALVDDAPHNLEELAGSAVVPVAYDHPYNRHLPGIRVHVWEELVELVRGGERSFLHRISSREQSDLLSVPIDEA